MSSPDEKRIDEIIEKMDVYQLRRIARTAVELDLAEADYVKAGVDLAAAIGKAERANAELEGARTLHDQAKTRVELVRARCHNVTFSRPAATPVEEPAPAVQSEGVPSPPKDLTARKEELLGRVKEADPPGIRKEREAIADWRRRQVTGDTEPAWGRWSDWSVELKISDFVDTVNVLHVRPHDTDCYCLELYGQAVSATGYRAEYVQPSKIQGRTMRSFVAGLVRYLARINGHDAQEFDGAPAWRSGRIGLLQIDRKKLSALESTGIRTLGDLADDRDFTNGRCLVGKGDNGNSRVTLPCYEAALRALDNYVADWEIDNAFSSAATPTAVPAPAPATEKLLDVFDWCALHGQPKPTPATEKPPDVLDWSSMLVGEALAGVDSEVADVVFSELGFHGIATLDALGRALYDEAGFMTDVLCELERDQADLVCERLRKVMPANFASDLSIDDETWNALKEDAKQLGSVRKELLHEALQAVEPDRKYKPDNRAVQHQPEGGWTTNSINAAARKITRKSNPSSKQLQGLGVCIECGSVARKGEKECCRCGSWKMQDFTGYLRGLAENTTEKPSKALTQNEINAALSLAVGATLAGSHHDAKQIETCLEVDWPKIPSVRWCGLVGQGGFSYMVRGGESPAFWVPEPKRVTDPPTYEGAELVQRVANLLRARNGDSKRGTSPLELPAINGEVSRRFVDSDPEWGWDKKSLTEAAARLQTPFTRVVVCKQCDAARNHTVNPCPSCGHPDFRSSAKAIIKESIA
jgi:hypothetical protein